MAGKTGAKAKRAGAGGRDGAAGVQASPRKTAAKSGRAPGGGKAPPENSARGTDQGGRRAAILKAGLAVFAEHGFEAARLDAVAARAGVAKGTLYLYFRDKQALFEEIVRDAASPLIARFEAMAKIPDVPVLPLLETLFGIFVSQVLGTERKLVLRLVISEGPRFPGIAKFYYDEVAQRGLEIIRSLLERGVARGEIKEKGLVDHPQLVIAPLLMAVLWDGLFQQHHAMDFNALARTHVALLSGHARATPDAGPSS